MIKAFHTINEKDIAGLKMVVIGDYCLDQYYYINLAHTIDSDYFDEPIYLVQKRCAYPGGAGNVAKNLLALGVDVSCIGLLGKDGAGYDLVRILSDRGAKTDTLFICEHIQTNTYLRTIAECSGVLNTKSELVLTNGIVIDKTVINRLVEALRALFVNADMVIGVEQFSSEETGVFSSVIKQELSILHQAYPQIKVLIDSRYFIHRYKDVYIKCNQYELMDVMHHYYGTKEDDEIIMLTGAKSLAGMNKGFYLTLGKNGVKYFDTVENMTHIEPIRQDGAVNTCGAGDSATAGIAIGLCLGFDPVTAGMMGNLLASITIRQLESTGEATVDDFLTAMRRISV